MQNREQLVPVIADILRTRTVDHWMASLRAANVPAGPINDFAQVLNDPQIRHREVLQQVPHTLSGTMPFIGNPVKFSDTPVTYHRGPPLLGEHTAEVLRELLDMDDTAIAALQKQGVVA